MSKDSPLDILATGEPVNDMWKKLDAGHVPTEEELDAIIANQRARRKQWLVDDAKKQDKKEK